LNIILQKTLSVLNNEVCVIGALVSGHCWWWPIVYLRCGHCQIPNPYNIMGEGEICHIIYSIYYVPYFLPFSNFVLFFTFPFLMIFNFYII
jgi:hypothetical protein